MTRSPPQIPSKRGSSVKTTTGHRTPSTNDGDSGRSWFSRYSTTSNPTANISVPATGAPLVATFPLAFQLDNSPNVERLTLTADTTSPTYDAVTVAAWLKTTVDDTNAKLICGWNASGSANTFALFVDDDVMGNNGQLRVVLKNAAGSTVFDLHGGFANGLQLNDGDWHHVAMVLRRSKQCPEALHRRHPTGH